MKPKLRSKAKKKSKLPPLSITMIYALKKAHAGKHTNAVARLSTLDALRRRGLIRIDKRGYMITTKKGKETLVFLL